MNKTCANWLTRCAIALLCAYGGLAAQAQFGATIGAVGLDTTWAAVRLRGTLRVAIDVGWRPFADMQNGVVTGYDADLARELGRRLGFKVEFIVTGFDALYDALATNRADMIASALPYNPAYGDRARFSRFYFNAGQVLMVATSNPAQQLTDLRGTTIGVALGSDADDLARRIIVPADGIILRNAYTATSDLLTALAQGEIAGAIVDNVTALAAVQKNANVRIISPALSLEPYVLAFPPQAFQLQTAADHALKAMLDDGFMEQLNQRWLK